MVRGSSQGVRTGLLLWRTILDVQGKAPAFGTPSAPNCGHGPPSDPATPEDRLGTSPLRVAAPSGLDSGASHGHEQKHPLVSSSPGRMVIMSTIVVVGAGVIGQTYAGLLADAGHAVSIVARGQRADRLRASGIVLHRGSSTSQPRCRVVRRLADARNADVVIVAVRGDQLPSVQAEVASSLAPIVVCMSNPLGKREAFEQDVGAERTVFAFSGIGGLIADDGSVHYRSVRQQPTVVDVRASTGAAVAEMMSTTGLAVHREHQMTSWLDTHSVFIAGIGAAVLTTENGAPGVARSRERTRQIVGAISEAFDALQGHDLPIRPAALRTIFGRVPTWFATRYWQRQFAGPMVQVSIAPHVLATRSTEFPQVVAHALSLVGRDAPRFRRLVMPCASTRNDA